MCPCRIGKPRYKRIPIPQIGFLEPKGTTNEYLRNPVLEQLECQVIKQGAIIIDLKTGFLKGNNEQSR